MIKPYFKCRFRHCIMTDIDTGTEYKGIYSDHRVDASTIPPGGYFYECRHCDSSNTLATVEPRVRVNFKGTFISETPIKFSNDEDKFINVERRWF